MRLPWPGVLLPRLLVRQLRLLRLHMWLQIVLRPWRRRLLMRMRLGLRRLRRLGLQQVLPVRLLRLLMGIPRPKLSLLLVVVVLLLHRRLGRLEKLRRLRGL